MGSSHVARSALAIALLVATSSVARSEERAAAGGAPVAADLAAVPTSGAAAEASASRGTVAPLRYKDPKPVSGAWRGPVGKWATGIGVVLLAGGATVAAFNKDLSDDLDRRFYTSRLRRSDADRYDRVDTYNTVSAAMLIAGGAATAAGIVLWSTAPDVRPVRGGATVGVQTRF
jgi:hypothetical protein